MFIPWLFLLPALVIAIAFHIVPFINTIILAFTDTRALRGGSFVGLDNFQRILHDDKFWLSFMNTAIYMGVAVPCLVVLPLLLAVLVEKHIPGVSFFRTLFFSPVVASMVVAGLIWTWMLSSDGMVNYVLQSLKIVSEPLPFLTDRWLLLFSSIFVTVWKGVGFYMILYLAALGNIPRELHESAAVDGASALRRFTQITIPGVRNTMSLVAVLSSVAAMKIFAEVYVMTAGSGGPGGMVRTLVFTIRETGLGLAGQVGYASAMSLVLFLFTLGLSLAHLRLSSREA